MIWWAWYLLGIVSGIVGGFFILVLWSVCSLMRDEDRDNYYYDDWNYSEMNSKNKSKKKLEVK